MIGAGESGLWLSIGISGSRREIRSLEGSSKWTCVGVDVGGGDGERTSVG
jgi:hypothetical protein